MADILDLLSSRSRPATTREVAEHIETTIVTTRRILKCLEVVELVDSFPLPYGPYRTVGWVLGPAIRRYAARLIVITEDQIQRPK